MATVQTFQQLRGPCVQLGQSVAQFSQRQSARGEVTEALVQLLAKLRDVTQNPDALNPQLAEYVFVPMSHVLRVSGQVPVRALELCLECLLILLQTGWRTQISPDLAGQFLILLNYLASPSSADSGLPVTSEELQIVAFKCIAALCTSLASTPQGRQSLTSTANIPALGRALLTILDSIVDAPADQVQLSSAEALHSLLNAIEDRDALASFLPKIFSSLTKALTPTSNKKRKFRLLQQSLQTLSFVFLQVLSDAETQNLPEKETTSNGTSEKTGQRSRSWLQATASQIKIALANILKLRNHDKEEVRAALCQLCLRIVGDCPKSLPETIRMVMETLVVLSRNEQNEETLHLLIMSEPSLVELLRESLRGWIISLPRLMQSKDDASRQQTVHQVTTTFRLLNRAQVDLSMINRILAENLRDSVSIVWYEGGGIESISESTSTDSMIDSSTLTGAARSTSFEEISLPFKGQDEITKEYMLLVRQLSRTDSSVTLARDLVGFLRSGRDLPQLASFWLSLNLVKDNLESGDSIEDLLDFSGSSPGIDAFLNVSDEKGNIRTELLDELYSFSLGIISETELEYEIDWRFQAIALEAVALQAKQNKEDFRVELIDVLYPVIHLLGSSNVALRNHAITCLNIVADVCGYDSTSDLVVSNVDYLVNAVALKLNTFDISPQAPQVLLMMIRLCGPSLLPYLDDLVESMFSALENFHGYPKLVELLFSVLRGMAEEGVRTPQLSITDAEESVTPHSFAVVTPMEDVVGIVQNLARLSMHDNDQTLQSSEGGFPERPWKEVRETNESDALDPLTDQAQPAQSEPQEPQPPAPKTFSILLKISKLTQHYLTSSSPTLRTSLLSLLNTTIPALAKHENSFLPLINTLWPVLLPRLEDSEAYVVSNALEIMGMMCQYAEDFMKSRIEQIWEDLKAIYRRTYRSAAKPTRGDRTNRAAVGHIRFHDDAEETALTTLSSDILSGSKTHYVDVPTRLIWDSLIRLLGNISAHVTVREEYFDDIMAMLEPVLDREDVAKSLDMRNPDAVWLRRLHRSRQGSGIILGAKSLPSALPTGKPHWKFVPLDT